MKKKNRLVLLCVVATLALPSGGRAAEEKPDFFGIKKFTQKGLPANPPQTKTRDLPAVTPEKTAGEMDSDSELTEEEKRQLKEIAEKAEKNEREAPETPELPSKEAVKLPPSALAAMPPKAPVTAPPKIPGLLPKNPNDLIIRIPQAPPRVPQNPNDRGANEPPEIPGTKK